MLKVNNVTKKYGKFVANNNLNFEVGNGEVAVLAGPNGAGKSTIIKSICGLLRFDGSIEIDGYDNRSIEAKRRIGYVPEVPALYEMLTVWEHLEFIARGYKLEGWEDYAEELVQKFELHDKKNKLGKELSKGMQQKVSICCALLIRPKVLVFDEPLVGLDPHAIKVLKETIKEQRDNGVSIIISTHMLESVEDYWDVAHIMMNGRIASTKYRKDIEADGENLEELFFSITEGQGDR